MLPITSLFVAAFAVALIALSLPVTMRRIELGAAMGDSDDTLRRRIRAQGNFIEYVPLALIAMGLVEAQSMSQWLVVAIGGGLAVGRLLHAIGMLRRSTPLRGAGMVLTYMSLLTSAAALILQTRL